MGAQQRRNHILLVQVGQIQNDTPIFGQFLHPPIVVVVGIVPPQRQSRQIQNLNGMLLWLRRQIHNAGWQWCHTLGMFDVTDRTENTIKGIFFFFRQDGQIKMILPQRSIGVESFAGRSQQRPCSSGLSTSAPHSIMTHRSSTRYDTPMSHQQIVTAHGGQIKVFAVGIVAGFFYV